MNNVKQKAIIEGCEVAVEIMKILIAIIVSALRFAFVF